MTTHEPMGSGYPPIAGPVRVETTRRGYSGRVVDANGEALATGLQHHYAHRLAAALNANQWRRIEEAPEDEAVLGWWDWGIVQCVKEDGRWYPNDEGGQQLTAPKYWMPSPADPPQPEPDAEETAVGLLREVMYFADNTRPIAVETLKRARDFLAKQTGGGDD